MGGDMSLTQVALNSVSSALNRVRQSPTLGYESEVNELEQAISIIKKVLVDTNINQETLTSEVRCCFDKLNEVIYEADDLFDKLLAIDYRKLHRKPSKKIINLFSSSSSSLSSVSSMKRVRKKCQDGAAALSKLHLPRVRDTRIRREETFPHLYVPNVIGREFDVETILGMLLTSEDIDSRDTAFLSIVGMGGLGKTALAQLVFNHPRVGTTFPLKIWVCVAEIFDFEAIRDKILESARGHKSTNQKQDDLLWGTRFLLVLDDVWCENDMEWMKIRELLTRGQNGSCVLATTRSRTSANMMAGTGPGLGHVYELQSLSEENSWRLFQMTAFDRGQELDSQLVEIGRKISARCSNIPLALKVVGSHLYCQDRHKWLACLGSFDNTSYCSDNILSTLRLSYDNLETPLKCCFSFCALFPKNFKIHKELLISLWMAQGYIEPSSVEGKCGEDVAEDYFMLLLKRCFIQDVEKDEYGDVVSCRIHDLMHDLAQQVAGGEIGVVEILASISAKIRHVFHHGKEDKQASFTKMSIRTYLQSDFHGQFPVASLVSNCMSLRALGLHDLDDHSLPESIGKLIHLRYLDLSRNKCLEMLPKSLTKLCYLETLDLRDCSNLEELPSDLSKLVLLRRLDIFGCELLTHMPSNMNNLTCLRTLTLFVVDEGDSSGKLEDLKALHNLKGCIEISIPANYTIAKENENQGNCLREMAHLKAVSIHFRGSGDLNMQSAVLQKLQPHQDLQGLSLKGYQGSAPHWAASIKKLVKLELRSCEGLIHLPFLSNLLFLKALILDNLVNLEYMEDANTISASPGSNDPVFFPSLEYLNISGLCKFENWWGRLHSCDSDLVDNFESRQLSFPRLSHLHIKNCRKLASFPPGSNVEKLCLTELNAKLLISDFCRDWHLSLKDLEVDDVGYLKSSAVSHEIRHSSINLRRLKIGGGSKQSSHVAVRLERSTTSEEGLGGNIKDDSEDGPWKLLYQSLWSLELDSLEKMMNLPKGMQHLTALKHLTISHCNNLKVLPEWISCLASLETLCIRSCTSLKTFPESMRKLTSLRHLEIQGHTYLQKRCQPVHGEDWPKIQHIHSISFH